MPSTMVVTVARSNTPSRDAAGTSATSNALATVPMDTVRYIDNPNTIFIIKVSINDGTAKMNVEATITGTGFRFNLPESFSIIPRSEEGATDQAPAKDYRIEAVMADSNKPLPNWLRFDSDKKTFVADQVPDDVDTVKVKIVAIRGDTIVGQAEMAIQAKQ